MIINITKEKWKIIIEKQGKKHKFKYFSLYSNILKTRTFNIELTRDDVVRVNWIIKYP